jgi:acetoin utilization deacetylase AcuC-like enzyme
VIRVFYSPSQTAAAGGGFSPSPQKPALVVDAWKATDLPIEIVEPQPASVSELCLPHDPDYVNAVLSGLSANGFGSIDPAITRTLPWTSGSLQSAAEHAVLANESVFSPTSGFHHAGRSYGQAFCTFNGLMVAAMSLHKRGLVQKVAILDCDQHFGDGTTDIIRRLHLDWVTHYTYGADPPRRATTEAWLEQLPNLVGEITAGADLVLFQAGADPHVDDPLGGALTTAQLAMRDAIVFKTCRRLGIPVVTNLAGGYQRPLEKVVALHTQTLHAFAAAWEIAEG